MSLCRVCLQDGASYPVFEAAEPNKSVQEMLSKCFKEKVEDIEGYPRKICYDCKSTIDTVWNFLTKLKQSQNILEASLLNLKQEDMCSENYVVPVDDNYYSEAEIEIKPCKDEPDTLIEDVDVLNSADQFVEYIEPKRKKRLKNVGKTKNVSRKKTTRNQNKFKGTTDKLASSILEGEFTWTGEKWCLTSAQINIPKDVSEKGKRYAKYKLPKKKNEPTETLCDLCGDVFKTQYKLSMHWKKIHFKSEVKCPQCPKTCTSEYNLKRHIKRKHAMETRDFMCATCGRSFAFKTELTGHIRKVHSGLAKKTFACKFCDKTYKCAKSVLIHERSVHTGERPAECTICNKGFFHEDYLREHMRLHTGEAPFKCPVCDRGYAQRGNMKSHLRIHRISELDSQTLSKIRPNYLKLLKA